MRTRRENGNLVWVAVAICIALLVLVAGDWIRNAIAQPMRFALCVTGAAMLASAILAYLASPARPFGMSASAWVRMVGAAALVGLVMFILFVQDVECELRSSGRGISTVCKEVGT
jgi:drug/metabolite transporter (DMT)-like permease